MKINKIKFLSVLIATFSVLTAIVSCNTQIAEKEEYNDPFGFKKDSRVCFVGNSITQMGMFHNNILLYHVTRFPEKNIQVFNCGVSGDVTWGVLDRMEEDILINKPTHAILMLGMNDVGRNWYGSQPTTDIDTLKHREKLLQNYKENMEKIVKIFLEKNIKVIIERPTIYDQTAVLPVENHFGVNDALGIYAAVGDSLALKYNLQTVDYYGIMNKINEYQQKLDSSFTITDKSDRVHPGETGHLIMAYEFLKSKNAPKYVSKIIINSNKKSIDECSNCAVDNILKGKNGITFSVKENSLPIPIKEEQKEGLALVPFMDAFNVELLKVSELETETEYQLKIDDELIGSFTGKQLEEGINLAEYHNTPQYMQSVKVLEVLQELWRSEGKLRGIRFIEYLELYKKIENKENLKVVEAFMDSAFIADGYNDPYYKSQLNKFIENKPKTKQYKNEINLLREKAYKLAIPVEHAFILETK